MNQLIERWNKSQTLGIKKGLQLLSPTEGQALNLSPKELFLIKEKSMRMKTTLVIGLNNLIWLLIFLTPKETVIPLAPLPLEVGHEIVKLPAQIFSESPNSTRKIHVILKHSSTDFQTSGYLRKVENDAYGTTGNKATIEIPKKDLEKLNSLTSYWLIYPHFKKQKRKPKTTNQRSFHEVIF